MTTVCFTGAGKVNGKAVTRAEWENLAREVGYYVTDHAGSANVLVASRTDTVKALNAAARGIKVLSYETFHIECLERGSVSDPWAKAEAERLAAAGRAQAKRAQHKEEQARQERELDEMSKNPLFNLF